MKQAGNLVFYAQSTSTVISGQEKTKARLQKTSFKGLAFSDLLIYFYFYCSIYIYICIFILVMIYLLHYLFSSAS